MSVTGELNKFLCSYVFLRNYEKVIWGHHEDCHGVGDGRHSLWEGHHDLGEDCPNSDKIRWLPQKSWLPRESWLPPRVAAMKVVAAGKVNAAGKLPTLLGRLNWEDTLFAERSSVCSFCISTEIDFYYKSISAFLQKHKNLFRLTNIVLAV